MAALASTAVGPGPPAALSVGLHLLLGPAATDRPCGGPTPTRHVEEAVRARAHEEWVGHLDDDDGGGATLWHRRAPTAGARVTHLGPLEGAAAARVQETEALVRQLDADAATREYERRRGGGGAAGR